MEFKEIIKGFELFDSGDKIGHIEFSEREGVLKITHTEVHDKYHGKDLVKKLVMAVVEHAKKHNFKIRPLCSTAHQVLRNDEFSDVLA
ncbi:GNAT family N-acetyltransferase [Cloacibacterium sp.]|uniref:GNAT family N-acetyltransferase n=1 Tax=Cloacibacterium sp. TaxID=1913682 RepID=UPI0039E701FD